MKVTSKSQEAGSSYSMGDNSRATRVEAIQPLSIVAVGAATKSAGVTNDPILIQSTKGSNVEDPIPIGLLSKKRKIVVDPTNERPKLRLPRVSR